MLCACIDIGSNTTRLLVAEVQGGRLADVFQSRAFTRLGWDLSSGGGLTAPKIAEVARVVSEYRALAEQLGRRVVRPGATAGGRAAPNRDELVRVLRSRAGVEAEVLGESDEARLAFLGATRTLGHALEGVVGVVDVGGGSTEVAVGTVAGGVSWSESLPLGSGRLRDTLQRSDPASPEDLKAMSEHAGRLMDGIDAPPVERAVAVGGSAASLRSLMGPVLDCDGMGRAVRRLCGAPAQELAAQLQLAPERVRLLPAGILVLDAAARRLGCPLEMGRGGVREGVCLELGAQGDTATV